MDNGPSKSRPGSLRLILIVVAGIAIIVGVNLLIGRWSKNIDLQATLESRVFSAERGTIQPRDSAWHIQIVHQWGTGKPTALTAVDGCPAVLWDNEVGGGAIYARARETFARGFADKTADRLRNPNWEFCEFEDWNPGGDSLAACSVEGRPWLFGGVYDRIEVQKATVAHPAGPGDWETTTVSESEPGSNVAVAVINGTVLACFTGGSPGEFGPDAGALLLARWDPAAAAWQTTVLSEDMELTAGVGLADAGGVPAVSYIARRRIIFAMPADDADWSGDWEYDIVADLAEIEWSEPQPEPEAPIAIDAALRPLPASTYYYGDYDVQQSLAWAGGLPFIAFHGRGDRLFLAAGPDDGSGFDGHWHKIILSAAIAPDEHVALAGVDGALSLAYYDVADEALVYLHATTAGVPLPGMFIRTVIEEIPPEWTETYLGDPLSAHCSLIEIDRHPFIAYSTSLGGLRLARPARWDSGGE